MRKIGAARIGEAVRRLSIDAAVNLSPQVVPAVKNALKLEKSPLARQILEEIIKNASVALEDKLPLCQDTGFAIVFLEIGQEVFISGDIKEAVNQGIAQGYKNLRKSIVGHPLQRKNTFNNTPAIIHVEFAPGDKIKIGLLPKGGGSENCSAQKMFLPSAGLEEIKSFIVDLAAQKAPSACPPIILGIGIGGTFDYSAYLAKKALTRPINIASADPKIAEMEKDLLYRINKLGIGPMGLGGNTTALAVLIETFPCHIASLPVAVNFECHSHRYREIIL